MFSSLVICRGSIAGPPQIPAHWCSSPWWDCDRQPSSLWFCICGHRVLTVLLGSLTAQSHLQISAVPVRIPALLSIEKPWTVKIVLPKSNAGGLTLPDFKTGQSCSNPKSVVPASRRTRGAADGELCRDGLVGWCRESLECTLQTALGDFCYWPDHPVAGEGVFPPQVLGKLDFHPQESESGLLPYCVFTS